MTDSMQVSQSSQRNYETMDLNYMKLGFLGMCFASLGTGEITNGHPWSYSLGLPIFLGSTAALISFYHSHKFTINGRVSFLNIAKVSLATAIIAGYNMAYFAPRGRKFDFS